MRCLLHDAWWRLATQDNPRSFPDALAVSVLRASATGYGGVVALRNAAYASGWLRPIRLPARVVSVGNLTLGGTGKTACVELIARKLSNLGRRVAILSRGYGGPRREYTLRCEAGCLLVDDQPLVTRNGLADEPQLLAAHLPGIPVLVGAKRRRTGRLACERYACDTLILDDGFQHRQLHRDCDVVVVHARMPFGGWAMFPRGPMREPLASLKRAQVIVVSKTDEALGTLSALTEHLRLLNSSAALVTTVHEPDRLFDARSGAVADFKQLDGSRVGLLSSIGDPEGFEATVKGLHAEILWHHALPDHHRYEAADWASVVRRVEATRPAAVVTTEKDWVRLQPWIAASGSQAVPVWVVGIRMHITNGEEALDARLAAL